MVNKLTVTRPAQETLMKTDGYAAYDESRDFLPLTSINKSKDNVRAWVKITYPFSSRTRARMEIIPVSLMIKRRKESKRT